MQDYKLAERKPANWLSIADKLTSTPGKNNYYVLITLFLFYRIVNTVMLRTYAVLFQNFHRPLSIYSQAAVKISLAPANIFTGRCQYFAGIVEILAAACEYIRRRQRN